jgi:hypothetical protein
MSGRAIPFEVLVAGGRIIIDDVVRLAYGVSACAAENDRIRTVFEVGNRQGFLGICVEQDTAQAKTKARGKLRTARAINEAWPHDGELDATASQIFTKESLLPDLGVGIDITFLGVLVKREIFGNEILWVHICQVINIQRTDQHDSLRTGPQDRLQEIPGPNDRTGKYRRRQTARFCSQMVDHSGPVQYLSNAARRQEIATDDLGSHRLSIQVDQCRNRRRTTRFADETTNRSTLLEQSGSDCPA